MLPLPHVDVQNRGSFNYGLIQKKHDDLWDLALLKRRILFPPPPQNQNVALYRWESCESVSISGNKSWFLFLQTFLDSPPPKKNKKKTFLGCGKHALQIRLISHWFQAQLQYFFLLSFTKYNWAFWESEKSGSFQKPQQLVLLYPLIAWKHHVTWEKCTSDQAPVLHWAGQGILLHALLISGFSPLQYLLWMERLVPSWRNWTQRTVRIWYPKLPQVLVQCSHSSVIHLSEDKWNVKCSFPLLWHIEYCFHIQASIFSTAVYEHCSFIAHL